MELTQNKLSNRIQPDEILLFIMVFVYPLVVVPGPWNYFRWPRYTLLVIISLLALYLVIRQKKNVNHRVFIPLSVFIVLTFISAILAPDFIQAIVGNSYRYTGFSTYFFCAVIFIIAINYKDPVRILKYMVVSAAVVSIIAIFQYMGMDILYYEEFKGFENRAFSTMGNANWLGTYTAFILPGSLVLFMLYQNKLWLLLSALIYAALLSNATRGAWIAFAVTMVIYSIYYYRDTKKRKMLLSVILILFVVTLLFLPFNDWLLYRFSYSIPEQLSSAVQLEDSAGTGRLFIWKNMFQVFRENWLFGVGPDHLEVTRIDNSVVRVAHNIYLEIAVSMGIFALLSYLVCVYYILRFWKGEWGFLFFLMLFTYLLQGISNNEVVMIMPIFWITAGLSLSYDSNNQIDRIFTDRTTKTLAIINNNKNIDLYVVVISLAIFLTILTLWYYIPCHGTIEIDGAGGGTYSGQLRASSFHGLGIWESSSGVTYTGEFKFGYFHGNGTIVYLNGAQYDGEFKEGYYHGRGKLITENGQVFKGLWEKGVFISSKN